MVAAHVPQPVFRRGAASLHEDFVKDLFQVERKVAPDEAPRPGWHALALLLGESIREVTASHVLGRVSATGVRVGRLSGHQNHEEERRDGEPLVRELA